jgi:hypothetical protein
MKKKKISNFGYEEDDDDDDDDFVATHFVDLNG